MMWEGIAGEDADVRMKEYQWEVVKGFPVDTQPPRSDGTLGDVENYVDVKVPEILM